MARAATSFVAPLWRPWDGGNPVELPRRPPLPSAIAAACGRIRGGSHGPARMDAASIRRIIGHVVDHPARTGRREAAMKKVEISDYGVPKMLRVASRSPMSALRGRAR